MKKIIIFTSVIAFLWSSPLFLASKAIAEISAGRQGKDIAGVLVEGQSFAKEISKAVGVSISPLLGMSVLGAYTYWKTPEDDKCRLEWYNSPVFWGPLLVILVACIVKDSAKTVLPIPKPVLVPLDALEAVENKISGLIGLFFVLSSIRGTEPGAISAVFEKALFSVAYAGEGLALSDPISIVKITLIALFALFCFLLVWLVSHTVNILILLCPFSSIDFLLKMSRNAVLALLLFASLINPYLGLTVSLIIVIFSYFVAGWSFRFMVFGSACAFDILLGRSKRSPSGDPKIRAFAGKDLPGVPSMSYGSLERVGESVLEFTYRPWLMLPSKRVCSEGESKKYEIGKGTLSPIVLKPKRNQNSYRTFFRLRPMYKSHEESVAQALGITSIRDVAVSRGIREGWKWLAEQLGVVKNNEPV